MLNFSREISLLTDILGMILWFVAKKADSHPLLLLTCLSTSQIFTCLLFLLFKEKHSASVEDSPLPSDDEDDIADREYPGLAMTEHQKAVHRMKREY